MPFSSFFGKQKNHIKVTQNNSNPTDGAASYLLEDPDLPSKRAVIYQSELDYISRCILDYPKIETGGQLFGFWTATGVPVVMYAIGPGRNAQHNYSSFVQDQDYLQSVGNELHRLFRLQHVGEWHSHHQLGLAHPSGGDVNTMQYGVGKPGFPRMLLCIGNCTRSCTTVNPFNFHENTPGEYVQALWDIVGMDSPFRAMADRALSRVLIHPATLSASHGTIKTVRNSFRETERLKMHWLTESSENVDTMKTFVSMVRSLYPDCSVNTEITESGEPLISLKEAGVTIKIPYGFPENRPVLASAGMDIDTSRYDWEIGEEQLSATFGRWIASVLPAAVGASFMNSTNQEDPSASETEEYENSIYGQLRQNQKTEAQETEIKKANARMQKLAGENQILSEYFHDNAFSWSEITERPVVSIVAFPYTKGRQAVIRMAMDENFPATPPEIQFGYYEEDSTDIPTLPANLASIKYFPLSDLFDEADKVYLELLRWNPAESILKAYVVASLLIHSSHVSAFGHGSIPEYLEQLTAEINFEELIAETERKIKEQKL